MFWNRKKKGRLPAGMTYRHPLDGVPQIAPGVTVHSVTGNAEPGLVLRRELDQGDNLRVRVMRKLRMIRIAHTKLDSAGSFYWQQIDGQRDLRVIADRLADEFKMSREDARTSVILFTKQLMLRHFIQIRVADPATAERP